MNEGTICLVTEFPTTWPPPNETTILHKTFNDTEIRLLGDSKGRLSFQVLDCSFTSQPIEFIQAHRALLFITWNKKSKPIISIHINSIELSDSTTTASLQIKSKPKLSKGIRSFDHSEASKACKEWSEWRKNRYSCQKPIAKVNRKLKPIESQVTELQTSIQSLEHFSATFSENSDLFISNALPHLRSLLFWPDGKIKNYNPLLLRISGHLGIDLPIFAFKDRIKETVEHELYRDAMYHGVFNPPSLTREYQNQELIDFQEWLNMKVISDKSSGEHKLYRWKDIIFEAANTISASHYDDDIPKFISKLRDALSWDKNLLCDYIYAVTNTTIILGNYTIAAFRENV